VYLTYTIETLQRTARAAKDHVKVTSDTSHPNEAADVSIGAGTLAEPVTYSTTYSSASVASEIASIIPSSPLSYASDDSIPPSLNLPSASSTHC
jgi:hypothetical protein